MATNDSAAKSGTAGATWAYHSQVVNDVRFNYSVGGGVLDYNTDTFGGGTPLPCGNVIASSLNYQTAICYLGPNFGTNMGTGQGVESANYQHQANILDTVSVQRGAHSLKFGVDYLRMAPSCFDTIEYYPAFPDISSYQTGITQVLFVSHYGHGVFLFRDLSLFGQDTWHVNSRLNITYGLRWEINFAPKTETGLPIPSLTGFSLTNLSNLALGSLAGPPFGTPYGNIAPRIGGAYRLSTDPDWGNVLRAGFGVYYGLASTEIGNLDIGQAYYPFTSEAIYSNSPFPPPGNENQPLPITPPNIQNGDTLAGFDPHLNLPYALEWNFALEQSLGSAQTFTLSYVGASDKRTLESENIVNPNPNYAAAALIANTGSLSYNALQAQFQRRLTNGLQALVSYSWSHVIDTGSYGSYSNGSFANVNANRGDSDYDLRNVFTTAITYKVPEWKNNLFTRAFTGGWATDDVVQLRTGPPISVQDANFSGLSQTLAATVIRPDVVPGQAQYLYGSQYPGGKALNPASFTDPPVDPTTGDPIRQGNLGRNARRALGLSQWDFAARREFPIHERLKLQFRAELFNILNHPNFGPFNSTFQSGNSSSASRPRCSTSIWAAQPVSEARTRSIRRAVRVPASWR